MVFSPLLGMRIELEVGLVGVSLPSIGDEWLMFGVKLVGKKTLDSLRLDSK